jgi:hypothetical protein
MTQDTKAESGQSANESVSSQSEQAPIEVNRSPEEYARRVKELANENERRKLRERELQAKLDSIEKERLEAQGKFQEIAEKEREKARQLEDELKKTHAKFAYQSVTSQIESEALKAGCVDTKAFLKLIDLTEVEVDDDFRVNGQALKAMIEKEAKEKAYLFQKQAASVKDLPPASSTAAFATKSIRDMSIDEKMALLRETMLKQKK